MNYYNEIDPYAAQWLRNLIQADLIGDGIVDERSIADVQPNDLSGFTQCHFFAGIAGWSYALRLAGIGDNKPVWTGSCPCQPLSCAGQRKGHADERHLWPAFYRLIAECNPAIIFGEQVASADGREWLAGIRADLEDLGYACGAADLCAASCGAPHKRQRLYWMARADGRNADPKRIQRSREHGQFAQNSRGFEGLAFSDLARRKAGSVGLEIETGNKFVAGRRIVSDRMGDAEGEGLQEQWSEYRPGGERHSGLIGFAMQNGVPEWNGPTVTIRCADGSRRVSSQPNAFPLAHGLSAGMGKLRAVGNAIVPQVAAEFISAFMECAP